MEIPVHLIQKYNVAGPRYTSYPPVPFWRQKPTQQQWIKHIQSQYNHTIGIDIYVHIPFCESLCYYCGCSRLVTKDHSVEEGLLETLLQEWQIYQLKLGFRPKISSLHLGGGTPTFLSPKNLETLIIELTRNRAEHFIGSIEVDPRTCTSGHIDVLATQGIKRVSLGIQDFDPLVQKAIHRDQSFEMVSKLVQQMRARGFESINFDLIYGLPKQTAGSIESTIDAVKGLKPDLIAFFSYAHLPERIKNQRLINTDDLPSPEVKRKLYEVGKKLLTEEGYRDVGMDHFALPTSFLWKAKEQKKLHRNFMGYVDMKSNILIGLGPSAISDSAASFMQNAKELKTYQESISKGFLAIEKGHTHSPKDLAVQKIILDLMCNNEVEVSNEMEIPHWGEIQQDLKKFATDGLLSQNQQHITLSEMGKAFMRNIAMSFDFYLREQNQTVKFSQTI